MSLVLFVLLHSLILKCWTAELQDITVVEAQTVELGCNCTSKYGQWLYNEKILYTKHIALFSESENINLTSNYGLEISNATISDEGLYHCKCNKIDVSVFNLTISVVPTLVLRLVSPSVPIGNQSRIYLLSKKENNLTLSCNAIKARPTSRITWEVNGGKVNSPPEAVTQNLQKNYTSDSKSVLGYQPESKTIDVTCYASGSQETNKSLQLILIYDEETEHDGLEGIIILGLITLAAVIFGVSFLQYKKKRYGKTQEIPQSPIDEVQTGHSLQASQHQTQIGNHGQHIFTMTTKMGLREIKLETKLPGKGMIRYWRAVDLTNSGKSGKCVARSITEQAQMVDLYSFKELAKCLVLLERNENVVNTIGVKIDDVPYYIYQEYITCGNLKDFMMGNYQNLPNSACKPFPTRVRNQTLKDNRLQLASFAVNICNALVFLAHQNYVHPALSARKVLLTEHCCCKLYDFWPVRLSSDRVGQIFKQAPPPVAWCAPETIFLGSCTQESDVWSFAVVLWEIFSLGETPYVGMSCEEIEHEIRCGKHLEQPQSCPGGLYDIMLSSWNNTVSMRPTMKGIRSKLSSCMQAMQTVSYNIPISCFAYNLYRDSNSFGLQILSWFCK